MRQRTYKDTHCMFYQKAALLGLEARLVLVHCLPVCASAQTSNLLSCIVVVVLLDKSLSTPKPGPRPPSCAACSCRDPVELQSEGNNVMSVIDLDFLGMLISNRQEGSALSFVAGL